MQGYWNTGRIFGVSDGLFQLGAIIAGFAIYAEFDDSCDKPIKEWVLLQAIYAVCVLAMIIVFEFIVGAPYYNANPKWKWTYYSIFGLLVLFNVVWIILGSAWLFSDSECYDGKIYTVNYDAWAYTLAILIIHYVIYFCAGSYVIFSAVTKKEKTSE